MNVVLPLQVLWNLERLGTSGRLHNVLQDHDRAVNRVAWDPGGKSLLLSGSQDKTVKCDATRPRASALVQKASRFGQDLQLQVLVRNDRVFVAYSVTASTLASCRTDISR